MWRGRLNPVLDRQVQPAINLLGPCVASVGPDGSSLYTILISVRAHTNCRPTERGQTGTPLGIHHAERRQAADPP